MKPECRTHSAGSYADSARSDASRGVALRRHLEAGVCGSQRWPSEAGYQEITIIRTESREGALLQYYARP